MKSTIKFTKNINNYKIGDIVELEVLSAQAFTDMNVATFHTPKSQRKTRIDLTIQSYKYLQKLCKQHNIPAVGTRESLIVSLTDIL